jgi:hypothetical protein
MDNEQDRQRLTIALTEAIWEAEWRMDNEGAEGFDDCGYEPQDLYGL